MHDRLKAQNLIHERLLGRYDDLHTQSFEWVVDREATCTEDGLRHRECPVCHLKKQEGTVIPKLGHDWSDVTYTWNEDNTQVTATRTCKRDASHVETETVAVSKSTKNPTCVATGSITYTSKSFNNSAFSVQVKTDTLEINPSNHNNKIGPVALKKATCTVDGVKAHYYCSACKKNFSDAARTLQRQSSMRHVTNLTPKRSRSTRRTMTAISLMWKSSRQAASHPA